ncbi:conjugal transfer protein TraG N-terminal domain-containing protein [Pseudomonas asiatica]|uniref:conjugal transfer protein TraG N-terminal domain-containing protein n=1 Tax=Pseudomonas asiatica TaxID=2219225 RepID=UPI00345C65E3
MEFTIYSIGSAAYLEEILNSVAMISGSGKIADLAMIGLLVGVFIQGFQAVFNNTAIQFQKVLVCLILYMAAFGPQVTVLIEDVYTGDVAVVDNVPLGPVAVGSIVSNLGYDITKTFEQAFSTPGMTSYGFADPLETLMKVRSITMNMMSVPSFIEGGGNENLIASWTNYLKECTFTGYGNDPKAVQQLMRNSDPLGGAKFESNVFYTLIYDGSNPNGRTYTCSQAHSILYSLTYDKGDGVLGDIAKLGFKKLGRPAPDYGVMESKLNDSLWDLGIIAGDARTFVLASTVLPVLQRAPGEKAIEELQGAAAIMMNDSMMKTNTQWAAEGSKFTQYVRPFMTFFEGFIYAITPLMAFIIVLGGFGISLISKYLLILVWMMLWMPLLSIVNLYILSQGADKISAVVEASLASGDPGKGISFQALISMQPVIENLLGTAGLMASSVPALSLFLVFGTSVAATGIANRLSGGDTINESIVAPDPLKNGAIMDYSSTATSDWDKGTRLTGSENSRGSVNLSQAFSTGVQSSRTKSEQSAKQFSEQLSTAYGNALNSATSISDAANIGQGIKHSFGLSNDAGVSRAMKTMESMGVDAQYADAVLASTAAGAGLQGSVSGGKGPGSVGANGSLETRLASSTNRSDSQKWQNALTAAQDAGLNSAVKSALDKTNGVDLAKSFREDQSYGISSQDSRSLSQAASKTVSDSEQYQQTEALSKQFGSSENLHLDSFTGKMIREGRGSELVNAARDNYGEKFLENFRTFSGSMAPDRADVAAAVWTLGQQGDFQTLLGSEANYDRNADLASPNVGNIEERTERAGNMVSGAPVLDRFQGEKSAAIAGADVQGRFQKDNGKVEQMSQVWGNRATSDIARRATENLRALPREVNDKGESSFDLLSRTSNILGNSLGTRASYESYMQQGKNYGLDKEQAHIFAEASHQGFVSEQSQQNWKEYADRKGMDADLRDGMFAQLVQAGLHDTGQGGHLRDVLVLNGREGISGNIQDGRPSSFSLRGAEFTGHMFTNDSPQGTDMFRDNTSPQNADMPSSGKRTARDGQRNDVQQTHFDAAQNTSPTHPAGVGAPPIGAGAVGTGDTNLGSVRAHSVGAGAGSNGDISQGGAVSLIDAGAVGTGDTNLGSVRAHSVGVGAGSSGDISQGGAVSSIDAGGVGTGDTYQGSVHARTVGLGADIPQGGPALSPVAAGAVGTGDTYQGSVAAHSVGVGGDNSQGGPVVYPVAAGAVGAGDTYQGSVAAHSVGVGGDNSQGASAISPVGAGAVGTADTYQGGIAVHSVGGGANISQGGSAVSSSGTGAIGTGDTYQGGIAVHSIGGGAGGGDDTYQGGVAVPTIGGASAGASDSYQGGVAVTTIGDASNGGASEGGNRQTGLFGAGHSYRGVVDPSIGQSSGNEPGSDTDGQSAGMSNQLREVHNLNLRG